MIPFIKSNIKLISVLTRTVMITVGSYLIIYYPEDFRYLGLILILSAACGNIYNSSHRKAIIELNLIRINPEKKK
jgi:lipoprotein signal peptidase